MTSSGANSAGGKGGVLKLPFPRVPETLWVAHEGKGEEGAERRGGAIGGESSWEGRPRRPLPPRNARCSSRNPFPSSRPRARPCGSANEAVGGEPVPEGREKSRQTANTAVRVAPRSCGGLEGAGDATGFPPLSPERALPTNLGSLERSSGSSLAGLPRSSRDSAQPSPRRGSERLLCCNALPIVL